MAKAKRAVLIPMACPVELKPPEPPLAAVIHFKGWDIYKGGFSENH